MGALDGFHSQRGDSCENGKSEREEEEKCFRGERDVCKGFCEIIKKRKILDK